MMVHLYTLVTQGKHESGLICSALLRFPHCLLHLVNKRIIVCENLQNYLTVLYSLYE